jgi:mono/diheme cytochrome c family protein
MARFSTAVDSHESSRLYGRAKKALEDRPKPEISAPTDAIVKITKMTVGGTDLHILRGNIPTSELGRILGHESVGVIDSIGMAVKWSKAGDQVEPGSVVAIAGAGPIRLAALLTALFYSPAAIITIACATRTARSKTPFQGGTLMFSDNHTSPVPAGNRSVIKTRRRPIKHVLMTVGVLLVLGVLGAAGVIFSGFFNVAATVADSPPLRWMFVTVREESIKRHARDIQTPPLADAAQRDRGFRLYRKECVMCHTPVGRTATPMALGFNPQAPTFEENDMTAAELFWAAKNGIRFTGMPAWGPSYSDQELWDVIAFVMVLPKMSAADYDAIDRRLAPSPAP